MKRARTSFVVALERGPRTQHHGARRHRHHDIAVDLRDPWAVAAVTESHAEQEVDGDGTFEAFHDAYDRVSGRRHEVDDAHCPAVALEIGFENDGSRAIAPPSLLDMRRRMDQPTPVLVAAEQRRETGRRVEARHAEPVDRSVAGYQPRAPQIANECIILDMGCH